MLERLAIWFVQHAVLLFVLFCITMGAIYQLVNAKDVENLSLPKRIFSQITSVLVVGICAGYALEELTWNPYLVSVMGILCGMGGDKVLRLILKEYEAKTLEVLITRFFKVWNLVRKGENKPTGEN